MLQDSPLLFHGAVALVGALLYLFLWRATADLPAAVRLLSRMAIAVVMLAPILLALLFGAGTPKAVQRTDAPAQPSVAIGIWTAALQPARPTNA